MHGLRRLAVIGLTIGGEARIRDILRAFQVAPTLTGWWWWWLVAAHSWTTCASRTIPPWQAAGGPSQTTGMQGQLCVHIPAVLPAALERQPSPPPPATDTMGQSFRGRLWRPPVAVAAAATAAVAALAHAAAAAGGGAPTESAGNAGWGASTALAECAATTTVATTTTTQPPPSQQQFFSPTAPNTHSVRPESQMKRPPRRRGRRGRYLRTKASCGGSGRITAVEAASLAPNPEWRIPDVRSITWTLRERCVRHLSPSLQLHHLYMLGIVRIRDPCCGAG
jgi:hypothetical protein